MDRIMMDQQSTATASPSAEQVLESLTRVIDPAFGITIVDLGIIYGIEVNQGTATIQMTLTSPETPSRDTIISDIRDILLKRHPGLSRVVVDFLWDPPWRDDFITEAGLQQMKNPLTRQVATPDDPLTEDDILDSLMFVMDPEVGINIVDLGLIYEVTLEGDAVHIEMTLTTPGCPLHATIKDAVHRILEIRHPQVTDVQMELVWEPPWDTEKITASGREQLGW